jgi:hypothetical protein
MKDEIIRMYAEATRIGLDTSETRDFLQAAADVGYRTGGNLENISNLLSAGVQGAGLEGPRGIEAAQTALEKIRQQTSEMGGLTGQYGIAELRSKEITKSLGGTGLDMGETAYLLGTDITKISDEYIQNLLENQPKIEEIYTRYSFDELKDILENYLKPKSEGEKEETKTNLINKSISSLFKKGDVFVFYDDLSLRVYESYLLGLTDQELFNMFEKEIIN